MNEPAKPARSISRRLAFALVLPVSVMLIAGAAISAYMARDAVNRLHNQHMQNTAAVLAGFVLYEAEEHSSEEYESESEDLAEEATEDLEDITKALESERGLPVHFRIRQNGETQFATSDVLLFPSCEPGFTTVVQNEAWQCFQESQSLPALDIELTVEVFERTAARSQAIRNVLLATYSPLILLPVLVLLLSWFGIAWVRRSLNAVSDAVAARSVDNLERLPVLAQPKELQPMAESVNKLLAGIERSLEREKQFTDDAAHELRTPITSIKMIEQLIRRENSDPALVGYLDQLRDGADQSQNLIDQLLRFARLQSARELEHQDTDLRDLIRAQLDLLAPHITAADLAIDLRDEAYQAPTRGNPAALSLLLANVLSNAVKFSPPTCTVTITLDTQTLCVDDQGPGIPVEDRERVFDRFYRGGKTLDTPGSGLGLALARWVAEAHHFTLFATETANGAGTRIVLRFDRGGVFPIS